MSQLAEKRCEPCRGEVDALDHDAIVRFAGELDGWEVVDEHHLQKRYETGDFARALDLVNRFGDVSEEQNHHPVLTFTWGWVEVRIWTHKIEGLTLSDFVLAAKFDRVVRGQPASFVSSGNAGSGENPAS